MFAVLCHEALVADVGEEEAFVDDDVGGILVGGVDGALIGVPFLTHVGIAVLLLVVLLLLLLPPLVALSLSLDIGHFAIK
jgi:GTPase involved in cell partitioning and DNA repair